MTIGIFSVLFYLYFDFNILQIIFLIYKKYLLNIPIIFYVLLF